MAWHPFIGPATASLLAGDPAPARQLIKLGIATPDDFSRGAITARMQDAASSDLGSLLSDIGPILPVAEVFFPEIAPIVTAAKVAVTGRLSPGELMDFPDFPDVPVPVDIGGGLDFPGGLPDWGSGGPDINLGTVESVLPTIFNNQGGSMVRTGGAAALGGAAAVGGLAMARGISSIVAGAILKLKQAMGGGGFLTAGGIASFGARTWQALTSWAARNPSLSIISTLVGLGLTVEEAAHFLAWGATRRRRKHRRGISYRDMRTTRRTMSRVISMSHQLRMLCGAVPRATRSHRHQVVNVPVRRR